MSMSTNSQNISANGSNSGDSKNQTKKKSRFTSDQYNLALKEGCDWMALQLANMIDSITSERVEQLRGKLNGNLPEEIPFKLFFVQDRLAAYTGFMKRKDGSSFDWSAAKFNAPRKLRSYDRTILPFTTERDDPKPGFSWQTIFTRRFGNQKTVQDIAGNNVKVVTYSQNRIRKAGVNPYLAQDVKRLLNPIGIKVIDVTDSSKSTNVVYEITAFPQATNYSESHTVTDYNEDFPELSENSPVVSSSPVKTGWAKVVMAPVKEPAVSEVTQEEKDEVKVNLEQTFSDNSTKEE